jgi:hypothetical protein
MNFYIQGIRRLTRKDSQHTHQPLGYRLGRPSLEPSFPLVDNTNYFDHMHIPIHIFHLYNCLRGFRHLHSPLNSPTNCPLTPRNCSFDPSNNRGCRCSSNKDRNSLKSIKTQVSFPTNLTWPSLPKLLSNWIVTAVWRQIVGVSLHVLHPLIVIVTRHVVIVGAVCLELMESGWVLMVVVIVSSGMMFRVGDRQKHWAA